MDEIVTEVRDSSPLLEYPCIECFGCDAETSMFLAKRICHSENPLTLYISNNEGATKIGKIDVNLDTLIAMSKFPMLTFVYHKSAEEQIELNLSDPYFIENFISF